MKIDLEPYTPTKKAQFWCNRCDHYVVDSEDGATGTFFVQFGHSFSRAHMEYDGNYTGVMFAFCRECIGKECIPNE
jgi:hypothetical protein